MRGPISKAVSVLLLALLFTLHLEADEIPISFPADRAKYRTRTLPFENGEKASYQATWNGIPVATAVVRTSPLWVDGKKFFQIDVKARTKKVLNLLWNMRDSIQSVFEAGTFHPKTFMFRQRENSRSTDTQALYNRLEKKWTVSRHSGKKISRFEIDSGNTFDPITATYLVRSVNFKVGDQLRFHVFGGKSRYLVTLHVVDRETVTTQAGTFDTYRITPLAQNLDQSGHADKVRRATIWISTDARRLPVKLQSEVFVGSVYLELIKAEDKLPLKASMS